MSSRYRFASRSALDFLADLPLDPSPPQLSLSRQSSRCEASLRLRYVLNPFSNRSSLETDASFFSSSRRKPSPILLLQPAVQQLGLHRDGRLQALPPPSLLHLLRSQRSIPQPKLQLLLGDLEPGRSQAAHKAQRRRISTGSDETSDEDVEDASFPRDARPPVRLFFLLSIHASR